MHELALKNNGKCLSIEYINTDTKYQWECNKKHQWIATSNSIRSGQWCPTCAKTNDKAQTEVYDFVKQFRPDALFNVKGLLKSKRLELDVYVPSLNKAVELDGEHWHNMSEAIERDSRKNNECLEVGIGLLRISYRKQWCRAKRSIGETMIKNFLGVD
jgi:hypothetical protein